MAVLTTVLSFLTIQFLILVTSSEADPRIEVRPSEISLGISSSPDINCSFFATDHPEMAVFVSLTLSKANSSSQTFKELAEITQFSPNSVTVLTQEPVTATGVHSQTGESFIHLAWDDPTASQAGVYQCVAHGMAPLGELVEAVISSTVTVAQADLNSIFEKLKQIEINEMNMEKHIHALEANNSQMSSYITDLQDTVATLRRLQLSNLDLIGSYQNHHYYISRYNYGDINDAIFVCKSCVGYLVEIDNEGEFNAIKIYLNDTAGFTRAVIAGTDEALDGTWILQSNKQPSPFTSWINSGASTGPGNDCLALRRENSWNMDDYSCYLDPPNKEFRFICEVPRV